MVSRNIVLPLPISQEDVTDSQRNLVPEENEERTVRYDERYVSPRRNIRLNLMDHMSVLTSQMS